MRKRKRSEKRVAARPVQLGIAPGRVTRRERTFLLEKLVGLSDRQAALAAGYSLSMANNTKQKIWSRPGVPQEFERLRQQAQGSE